MVDMPKKFNVRLAGRALARWSEGVGPRVGWLGSALRPMERCGAEPLHAASANDSGLRLRSRHAGNFG
jgi:hypothetical protein